MSISERYQIKKNRVFVSSERRVIEKEDLNDAQIEELFKQDSSLFEEVESNSASIRMAEEARLMKDKDRKELASNWEKVFGKKPNARKSADKMEEELKIAFQYRDLTGNEIKDITIDQMKKEIAASIA